MRTIVDLPDDQLRALDDLCLREGISRAEAVRRAVARYLDERSPVAADDEVFGLWRGRAIDALAYEDDLRGPRDAAAPAAPAPRTRKRRTR